MRSTLRIVPPLRVPRQRAYVFNGAQLLKLVLLGWLSGFVVAAAIGVMVLKHLDRLVEPLQPVVEHRGADYEIVRLPFSFAGREWPCRATLYRDRGTWSVTC